MGKFEVTVSPTHEGEPRKWGVSSDEFHVDYFDFLYDAAAQGLAWGLESREGVIEITIDRP